MASAINNIDSFHGMSLLLALDPKLRGKGLKFNTLDQTIIVPKGTNPMQAGFLVLDDTYTHSIREAAKTKDTTLTLRTIEGTKGLFHAVFIDENTHGYSFFSGERTNRRTTTDDLSQPLKTHARPPAEYMDLAKSRDTETPVFTESTKETETRAPANQTAKKPSLINECLAKRNQQMLHTSITKYRYLREAKGCCAKICRIFKAIIFFLLGQFGYCLGIAQDKKISIGLENSHIAQYENELDEVVASLPRGGEKAADNIGKKFQDLYRAYKWRQTDAATLNMPLFVWKAMHLGVLADLKAKIEKHNQKNPTKKINAELWLNMIQGTFKTLDTATAKERAEGYLDWYAEFITPEHIAKDGLKLVAEFAGHYCKLHGNTNLSVKGVEGAALLLRAKIAKNEKQVTVFSKALSAISKKSDANKQELTQWLTYFTGDLRSEGDQTEFLKAVFAPKAQKATE